MRPSVLIQMKTLSNAVMVLWVGRPKDATMGT